MKSAGIAACMLLCGQAMSAQSPMLKFQVAGLSEGDTIYLANYYGNKMYYADTAVVGSKGRFEYASPTPTRAASMAWCCRRTGSLNWS